MGGDNARPAATLLAHLQREARDARVRANASREENEIGKLDEKRTAPSLFEEGARQRDTSVMGMMLIYRSSQGGRN